MWKLILTGILGVLLVCFACNEFSPDSEMVPSNISEYYITGTVTDNNGNPVEGATVKMSHPYEPGMHHSPEFHLCATDDTDSNGDYALNVTEHMHADDCLFECIPPQGSGLTTQTKKVYVPGDKDYEDLPLVDWVLLPPK
jgi:hypothetical protein